MNITIGMIGTIASIIAAVVAYMTLRFTVHNSKGYILKQIDKKKKLIREIDIRLVNAYGLNRGRAIQSLHWMNRKKSLRLR